MKLANIINSTSLNNLNLIARNNKEQNKIDLAKLGVKVVGQIKLN
tara:strand:- start:63 stop:197 length:135 start_codon:yes stop_codon:yes gene_type:complete